MQRGLAKRKLSVCPSLCPSVKRVICDRTKERCAHILMPHKRTIYPRFVTRRMFGGGDPFSLKFYVKLTSWSENADFQSIFAYGASAVTPSEKSSIITDSKSTTNFPMSLKVNIVRCP